MIYSTLNDFLDYPIILHTTRNLRQLRFRSGFFRLSKYEDQSVKHVRPFKY